jgi:antitoxin HicB
VKRKAAIAAIELAYICRFHPEPEGGFTVTCPSLPPVVTYGETLDEARQNVREAILLCLEVMKEDGQSIPPADGDPRKAFDELIPVAIPRG